MQDLFVGVQSSYEDLYMTLVFLASLWLVGDVVCRRCLKIVPSLVGHIAVGILFGPEGFDVVQPSPEQWVLLGNLGLLMLILQAGLEMDFQTLKLVGPRGVIIAIIGSILPISIGTGIAAIILRASDETLDGSFNWKNALAAGCSFGPTSAGIAMNVLGQCQVLHTPVGQLVIAAAIVDDILALVILSQLRAFTSGPLASITDTIIPIASAFIWLLAGGSIALFIFPSMFQKVLSVFSPKKPSESQNARWTLSHTTLMCFFGLLFGLLPSTYYSQSSYLLGVFLTGLAFCRDSSGVDLLFRKQFKQIMAWLMKIFFAATIGFQVPVRSFANGTVLARGVLFACALLGKVTVGILVPNFHSDVDSHPETVRKYRGLHLRDCLVVGFSMMGEAEFAFVVAVFGVTEGLFPPDIYASIVLAILMSTMISPLLLKMTLLIWNTDEFDPSVDGSRSKLCCEKDIVFSNKDVSNSYPDVSSEVLLWEIQIECKPHTRALSEIMKVLLQEGDFIVIDTRSNLTTGKRVSSIEEGKSISISDNTQQIQVYFQRNDDSSNLDQSSDQHLDSDDLSYLESLFKPLALKGVLQNMVVSSCKHAIKGTTESPGSILSKQLDFIDKRFSLTIDSMGDCSP